MVEFLAGAVTSGEGPIGPVPGGPPPSRAIQTPARLIALPPGPLRCGAFTLDPERRRLRDPAGRPIELRPKSYDVLRVLLLRAGRLVGREELLDAVWGDIHVTDDSVTQCIVEIRRALGAEAGVAVRTVPRRGYLLETHDPATATAEPVLALAPFREIGPEARGGLGAVMTECLALGLAGQGGLRLLAPAWLGGPRGRRALRRGGARYLLRGSLWRAEGRICVVVQMLETGTARLVWAERFERAVAAGGPLPAADEVASRIARAVAEALPAFGAPAGAEGRRVLRLGQRR